MKKIKTIILLLVALVSMAARTLVVDAASLSISGSSSTTNTVIGNTFTVTFKFSSGSPLGAVVYSMSYDSNLLTLTSGTQSNALSYTGSQTSDSVKFTFKAKAKGSATITFKVNEALDFDGNNLSVGNVSKTINIKSQADIEASYSKNNNLSNLTISAGTLSPSFNKNTLEYSAEVENEVTQITVSGSKEDSKSYVDGFKDYTLEEGINKIEVKVTAQNGSAKVYVINITRKELAPIIVKDENDNELAVIRKKELIKSPNSNYEEASIKIGEDEVPGFYNKITNTYLVGLKDKDGNIKLYKYENDKYTLYEEYTFDSIIITGVASIDIPKGYKEEKITINDKEITAYKDIEEENNFYLIGGINIATGEEHLYQYDEKEKTIQIFNNDLLTKIDLLNDKNNNYLYVIIGLGSLLIITYIFILIANIRKNKKKIKKLDDEISEEKEKTNKKEKKKKKKKFDFGDEDISILDVVIEDENKESTDNLQKEKKKKKKDLKEIEQKSEKDDKIEEDISNE